MKRTFIRNMTVYEEQARRIDEAKKEGFNFSKFVRHMVDTQMDEYIKKLRE